MIRIRSTRRNRVDIAESGALSDLAFLLIIFFIVIAVFNVNSGFLLGLPQPGSVTTVYTEELMRLRVTNENLVLYDGETVTLQEVHDLVQQRRRQQANMTLLVVLEPDAAYQMLVSIVEIARVLDVDNFSFSMVDLGVAIR